MDCSLDSEGSDLNVSSPVSVLERLVYVKELLNVGARPGIERWLRAEAPAGPQAMPGSGEVCWTEPLASSMRYVAPDSQGGQHFELRLLLLLFVLNGPPCGASCVKLGE